MVRKQVKAIDNSTDAIMRSLMALCQQRMHLISFCESKNDEISAIIQTARGRMLLHCLMMLTYCVLLVAYIPCYCSFVVGR